MDTADCYAVEQVYHDPDNDGNGWFSYVCGGAAFGVEDFRGREIWTLFLAFHRDMIDSDEEKAQVRNLWRLLNDPRVQRIIGLGEATTDETRVAWLICDDDLDPRYGQPIGLQYLRGECEVYFPLNLNVPAEFFAEIDIFAGGVIQPAGADAFFFYRACAPARPAGAGRARPPRRWPPPWRAAWHAADARAPAGRAGTARDGAGLARGREFGRVVAPRGGQTGEM